ncbi:hypothetical protein [Sporosarcina sp. FA9]|uniref:hypothetical protein n=1 Tax=Sporosarcina sp. FA9 TaxID=3413030 RepID=UPI003F655C24
MFKKLFIYILMLAIGCTFLVLAIVLDFPEKIKWPLLAIAIILNGISAVAAMKYGLKEMKPN